MLFVVDSSALVKRLSNESESVPFSDWMDRALDAGDRFAAPHILRYELGNVLARLARSDAKLTASAREKLVQEALFTVLFADGSTTESHAPPLSYYDASYLSLAQAMKATLVSYDKVMLAAAKKAGIPTATPT